MEWIELGKDVHSMYRELLDVGNSLMRVEDHLTMQIPGVELELGDMKAKLSSLIDRINRLVDLVQPAGVNND